MLRKNLFGLFSLLLAPDTGAGGGGGGGGGGATVLEAPAAEPGKEGAEPRVADSELYSEEIDGMDDDAEQPKGKKPDLKVVDPDKEKEGDDEDLDGDVDPEVAKAKEEADAKAKKEAEEKARVEADKTKPGKTRDLKVVYEKLKSDHAALEAKHAEAAKKLQSLEAQKPEETKALIERVTKAEARAAELEEEIGFQDYSKSAKFVEEYKKPYLAAWERAVKEFAELSVSEGETGTQRAGTAADLLELSNLPLGQARRRAVELFGDGAEDAMAHRRIVRDLAEKQDLALQNARGTAKERKEQEAAQRKIDGEKHAATWHAENNALTEKYPNWFKPVEGDDEGNALFQSGLEKVDRLFNDTSLKPEEKIKLHVEFRNKVANHDRLALRLKRTRAKLGKLTEELKAFRGSAPAGGAASAGRRGTAPGKSYMESVEAELDALDDKKL